MRNSTMAADSSWKSETIDNLISLANSTNFWRPSKADSGNLQWQLANFNGKWWPPAVAKLKFENSLLIKKKKKKKKLNKLQSFPRN